MENVLNFIIDNWVAVSGVILWLAARLVKTEKNYDLIEGIIKFIGNNVIPNRRKSGDPIDNGDYKPGKNNTPNNILRLVVLYVMFGGLLSVLPLQSSLAQLNGNFKTVRFVNVITPTDTANVLPINATIYYNEVTNKLMAYENGQWKELIRSGGGGITTASNGLNVVGSDVQLGGNLTGSVIVNGSNVNTLTLQASIATPSGSVPYYQINGTQGHRFTIGNTTFSSASTGIQIDNSGIDIKSNNFVDVNGSEFSTSQLNLNTLNLRLRNATADPAGVTGLMYYNSLNSKFRAYEGATWKDLIVNNPGNNYEIVTSLGDNNFRQTSNYISNRTSETNSSANTTNTFNGLNLPTVANNSIITVEAKVLAVKNDGSDASIGTITGFFRKDNTGTWTADYSTTADISDATIVTAVRLVINGGLPGVEYDTGANGNACTIDVNSIYVVTP